jgi:Tfp pilus assembly protein PilF
MLMAQARSFLAAGRISDAEAVLRPRLAQSPDVRAAWMNLAVLGLGREKQAPAWLQEVEKAIPVDQLAERLLLAQAWYTLAGVQENREFVAQARRLIDAVAESPTISADHLLSVAVMFDAGGDDAVARDYYHQVLKRNADQSLALNNLAMILAETPEHLVEARRLATRAAELLPSNTSILDTLAFVHAQAGDLDRAIVTIRQAVQLEPDNADWRLSLATWLARGGKQNEARQILDHVVARSQTHPLTDEQRRRLQALQKSMAEELVSLSGL